MKPYLIVALLLSNSAIAGQICDMQKHCYNDGPPRQIYHGDLAHPDLETGPPVYNESPQPMIVYPDVKRRFDTNGFYIAETWTTETHNGVTYSRSTDGQVLTTETHNGVNYTRDRNGNTFVTETHNGVTTTRSQR
jgi:hypothetical protein